MDTPKPPRPVLAPDKVAFDEALHHAREGTFYEDYDRAGLRVNCLQRAHDAMQRFCDRVEAGEVRSRRTYAEFCDLLGRAPKA
jgi:hypothetical protein